MKKLKDIAVVKSLQAGDKVSIDKAILQDAGVNVPEGQEPDIEGVVESVKNLVATVKLSLSDGKVTMVEISQIADRVLIVGQRVVSQGGFFKKFWKSIKDFFKGW